MVRPVRTDETLAVQANVEKMRQLLDDPTATFDEDEVTAVEFPPSEPPTTGTGKASEEVARAATRVITVFDGNGWRFAVVAFVTLAMLTGFAIWVLRDAVPGLIARDPNYQEPKD